MLYVLLVHLCDILEIPEEAVISRMTYVTLSATKTNTRVEGKKTVGFARTLVFVCWQENGDSHSFILRLRTQVLVVPHSQLCNSETQLVSAYRSTEDGNTICSTRSL